MRIIGICGSLRKQSFNMSLLRAAAEVAPAGVEIAIYPLDDLPFYNADVEASGAPDAVTAFCAAIETCDGMIMSTPEYSHAYSGLLKNALDWCSEPKVLKNKPVTTLSAAPNMGGGVRAQMALREVLFSLNCAVMTHYELLVRTAKGKFDQDGTMTDAPTRDALCGFVADFVAFVNAGAKTQNDAG